MGSKLGLALKVLRIAYQQSQRDVALRAEMSASVLSDIENGWRDPSP
jgi:transcriptional regulator with XRE-family HTH domain